MTESTPDRRWLEALLPFVRDQMPAGRARVVEIGCGPLGGFVPALSVDRHDVTGVDPDAPDGPEYHRGEFESYDMEDPLDAVVACTSLHHVTDLAGVLDKVAAALAPDGVVVVVEWARECFDEATARWCFDRLAESGEERWLHRHRDAWRSSGQSWNAYLAAWADEEGLHTGEGIITALRDRFDSVLHARTPYVFPDLHGVSEAAEQVAIDAGLIRPLGIRYVGRRR